MTDEYTPTTEEVREAWLFAARGKSRVPRVSDTDHGAQFDRWVRRVECDCHDPYEPVCDTCRGDGIVRIYTGRAGQQTQPCPDCIMRGVTK